LINCGIYIIRNIIDNKVYIGSSNRIKSRISYHKYCLKINKHCNQHLQNAWNKYREISFIFGTIERCNKCNLLIREEFYIEKFESWKRSCGYNLQRCPSRPVMSEETKRKISEYWKNHIHPCIGKKRSLEIRKKISDGLPDMGGKNNSMYGRRQTKESIRKNCLSNSEFSKSDILEIRELSKIMTAKEISILKNMKYKRIWRILSNRTHKDIL